MTVAQEIAEFVVATGYGDIPGTVLEKTKECILDSIGVALYGSGFEASRIALTLVEESAGSEGTASILGRKRKAIPSMAAFINGVMAHVADFDDILISMRGHPSSVLMPSTMAACEVNGGSGMDLLTAFVVGSEVGGKLGEVMGWGHYELGWHGAGTMGAFAATVAAAKALNLSRDQVVNALAIAASSASGLRVNFGTMTKSYHTGHAAMMGVWAAQLAQRGFNGSPVALEGETGFGRLFGCAGDLSSVPGSLGEPYALNQIILKYYPSCGSTHPPMDAILKNRDQIRSRLEEVEEIEVQVRPVVRSVLIHHDPQTELQAKFSLEYCVSAALVFGQLGVEQFEERSLFDSRVRGLIKKVRMIPDASMERVSEEQGVLAPVRVRVKLRGGEEYVETVWEAKGGPSNPMSRDEIRKKFRECTTPVLNDTNAQAALEMIDRLETLRRVTSLTSLLTG